MSELRDRVVERLVTAQNVRDPAPLRDQAAVADALALLREAAPWPEDPVDLDSVAAVLWTFWFRHLGPEDPEAPQNVSVVTGTFGFLYPRVPDRAELPADLAEGFDATDPSHEARFAYLVSAAHAEAVVDGAQEQLAHAVAWSDIAFEHLRDDDTPGFVELATYATQLHVTRFQSTADPDGLAAAARYARAVCDRLGALDPELALAVAEPALRTLVDAARLLGTPPLPVVERYVAAAPAAALSEETAEGLDFLRLLDAQPVDWPGERDLFIGTAITEAGAAEHDAGRIACAVRRLRTALAATPAGHPAHPRVTVALGQALVVFAREREDETAAVEAMELFDSVGALSDERRDMLAVYRELREVAEGPEPADLAQVGPLLGRLAGHMRASDAELGGTPDIETEIIDLSGGFDPGADTADDSITRYRTALRALPADQPHRHAYVAVLAALTGRRAEALRDSAPARAGLLAAEARELTEEARATGPDGFLAGELLTLGRYEMALPMAVLSVETGDVADSELRTTALAMTRLSDLRLDSDSLDSDIGVIREVFAGMGDAEIDTELRPYLAGALGAALSARSAERADLAGFEEIVELLREARANASDMPGEFDRLLANALTATSLGSFDPEGPREVAALIASIPDERGVIDPEESGVPEADQKILAARTEVHNALQNYMFGHEPAELDRARGIAHRMRELSAGVPRGDEPPWHDLMGDVYADMLETVGPGGGPRADLDDTVLDRCRATFARTSPGHPARPMAAMTLARSLARRAMALRPAEPERAAALLAEAGEVNRLISAETPESAAIDPGAVMRVFLDALGEGRLPDQEALAAISFPGADQLFSTLLLPLQDRLSGDVDPAAWRAAKVPVFMRVHGHIGSAAGAIGRNRVDQALVHLEAAVEDMAALTDRGSDQASAEHGLSSFEGDIRTITELIVTHVVVREITARLPAQLQALQEVVRAVDSGEAPPDPALLADLPRPTRTVESPDVDRALELLERGRGLLLARRMEARADVGDLRAELPDLADEFDRLTGDLDARPETGAAGAAEWARLAGLRTSRQLDDLVRRIRTHPGFEGFLRPLAAPELKALAADGPVIVLNHGRQYCHALVVTDRSITALPLDPKADDITEAAGRLRDAVDAINARGAARPSPGQLVAAGRTVREILAWTWHRIVRPVLELAGTADPVPRGGQWPRVWWVPTGPFSALPLHAAQCTARDCSLDGDCGAALDTVVSSYVPGLQTLAYARSRARQREATAGGEALLVAAPEDELPGVAGAAAYAAELLGARAPLIGTAATRETVLDALRTTPWAHFGCHAATDPTEPSGAVLHLPGGEAVSVLEICRARPRAARLAFLAACGTARTAERLTDEAIHITSSFLLAGFPAAVGTLWTIDSTHADHMTRDFYRRTTAPGALGPAHALHDTVRQLRRRIPERPDIWAAYVHAGT